MQSTFHITLDSHHFHFPWKTHQTHFTILNLTFRIPQKPFPKTLTLSNSLKTLFNFYESEEVEKADESATTTLRLPVVIRRPSTVSRYFWDGNCLQLVHIDGGNSSVYVSLDDEFGKLCRFCGSAIRDFFIPRRVNGNYMDYVKWKFLHRVFSSALQVLATQAMFRAIGLGYSRSLASAAALNWVLKDGLGRLCRCIYTASLASVFDTNLKACYIRKSLIEQEQVEEHCRACYFSVSVLEEWFKVIEDSKQCAQTDLNL